MRLTQHAKVRIRERNISSSEIQDLIDNGVYLVNRHNPERFTLVHKDRSKRLAMVLSNDKQVVITIMYQGGTK